jgi:glycosyltransferase involved in cell wall biosynthesis
MEYMAFALPSVAFDLHETRTSAGECALFVSDGDITAFADAVERLLDDEELRRRLGAAGRRRAEAYLAWPRVTELTLEAYDEARG